jgi:hypothetical protein
MGRVIVTTSWDDGHPLDLRVAEMLARRNMRGTFYVPLRYTRRPVLSPSQMRKMQAMGMEIGSHTLTHPVLTGIPASALPEEVRGSKAQLEDLLGCAVDSFCYPKGKSNHAVRAAVRAAGYRLGRTTVAFRTARRFEPWAMPVTCQFTRQSRFAQTKHALREGNLRGLATWWGAARCESDPVRLARRLFEAALAGGGIFHLWGHSWELEAGSLWRAFEETLDYLAWRPDVAYSTNVQVLT